MYTKSNKLAYQTLVSNDTVNTNAVCVLSNVMFVQGSAQRSITMMTKWRMEDNVSGLPQNDLN